MKTFALSIFVIFFSPSLCFAQTTSPGELRTKVVEVELPSKPWPGWEKGLIDEDPNPVKLPPQQFIAFPTPANERPAFSGKVVGLDSLEGAEVVIVSVYPGEYLHNGTYEPAMVRADGTFSLISSHSLDQPKTICLRAPGHPWTFLRHQFPAGQSARDIVLKAEPAKRLRVSAQLQSGEEKPWMTAEAFDGYQQRDDDGKPLQSQYHGGWQNAEGSVQMLLPLRPMALRIRADRSANSFVMVDPREVDHLIVLLPRESRLRARVVSGEKPAGGKPVVVFNIYARLSLAAVETDTRGWFELPGLMPGPFAVLIGDQRFMIDVRKGQTTEATFDLASRP